MKKQAKDLKQWIIWQLRRLSYRWPPRQRAFQQAAATKADYKKNPGEKVTKRVRNFYFCAVCDKVFSRKGVSADHLEPVVNPKKGWENFDTFIRRLFCSEEGFQIICHTDHDEKTQRERLLRKKYKEAA